MQPEQTAGKCWAPTPDSTFDDHASIMVEQEGWKWTGEVEEAEEDVQRRIGEHEESTNLIRIVQSKNQLR